jgi:hypothetical protein
LLEHFFDSIEAENEAFPISLAFAEKLKATTNVMIKRMFFNIFTPKIKIKKYINND